MRPRISASEISAAMSPANPTSATLTIFVDADACPNQIKEVLFRTATRRSIPLVLIANQTTRAPDSKWIKVITVFDGADVADDKIVELVCPGDLVITGDVPLASRVVEKEATAIGPRGELFDDSSVHGRLATRNLMEQFRSAGFETAGPRPLSQKDIQAFSNLLDRTLTRALRRRDSR